MDAVALDGAAAKQEGLGLADLGGLSIGQGRRPKYKLATVHITLIFPVLRRRDIDNYAPKMILDGLVNAGLIQDDRNDWVKVTWDIVKGNERKTVIDIQKLEVET